MDNEKKKKGRRVTIDLSASLTEEVERLKKVTGHTSADLFRYAISLLRIYVQAKENDQEIRVVNREEPDKQVRLELPFIVTGK